MTLDRPAVHSRRQMLAGASALVLGSALSPDELFAQAGGRRPLNIGERTWRGLAEHLPGGLVRPGDQGYAALARPNNLRYLGILPAGIARCRSAADVGHAIRWCRDNRVPLAARSGGHSYAGFSTTRGLMIDLSLMNEIAFDPASGRVRLAGGVRNGGLYAALQPHRVTVTHGRCAGVGAAAFVLGGGIGFNMREHGLACDQVIATEIVTADGEVRTADADRNTDLFWACRGGGGGNFGISTSFTLETFAAERVVAFEMIWRTRAQDVFAALMPALAAAPTRLGSRVSVSAISPRQHAIGQEVSINLVGQFKGTAADLKELLEPAYRVAEPASALIHAMDYWDAQSFLSERDTPAFYQERSAFVADHLDGRAIGVAFAWLKRWPGTSAGCDLRFFQTGGRINAVAADATAFVHRNSRWLMVIGLNWTANDTPERLRAAHAWQDGFYRALLPFTTGGAYQNFPDISLPDWPRAYYGGNLARLARIKGEVDPGNLFRFAQSIRPSLAPAGTPAR